VGSSLLVDPVMLETLGTSGLNALSSFSSHLSAHLPSLLAETNFLTGLLGTLTNILQVALGLGFVIFVHELGHFLAAKTFGVRCDKFYVGFDVPLSIGPIKFPRTLGKFQWGETEYGIGIIPLGGYVKMLGQDDDPRQAEAEAERIRLGEGTEAPLDPRSYPAKPVWQRMIIISAGVVMNLFFAVIMAGTAYWLGVRYEPTVVGTTIAGSPAWEAGLEPGDQIVRFGDMTEDDPNLRYDDFATGVAIRGFDEQDAPLAMTVLRGDQRMELTARPTAAYTKEKFYRIGMSRQSTAKLGKKPFMSKSYLANSSPDLQANDIVTEVNGETLPVDERYGAVLGSSITERFQANWREPVTLTIERPGKKSSEAPTTHTVELPPVPVKTVGIGFAPGPITAVQAGSVAAKAGVKVGDVIEKVNGEVVVDGLQLPSRVAELAGQDITLTLRRPSNPANPATEAASTETDATATNNFSTVEVTFKNVDRPRFDPIAPLSGRLSLAGVGIAFDVSAKVSVVSEEVAAETGIAVGDELIQYHWLASSDERGELKEFSKQIFEPQIIDQSMNVPVFFDTIQVIPEGASIKLSLRRDGKTRETTVPLTYAEDWYWYQRGLSLNLLQQIHQTDSLAHRHHPGLVGNQTPLL
jgi:regulator of sigma E protease